MSAHFNAAFSLKGSRIKFLEISSMNGSRSYAGIPVINSEKVITEMAKVFPSLNPLEKNDDAF